MNPNTDNRDKVGNRPLRKRGARRASRLPLVSAGFAALALGGCTSAPAAAPTDDFCAGVEVTGVEAWVNRMPQTAPGGGPTLIVTVSASSAVEGLTLTPSASEEAGVLRLVVGAGKSDAPSGQAVWRQPAGRSPPQRIEILCDGEIIAWSDEVEAVY